MGPHDAPPQLRCLSPTTRSVPGWARFYPHRPRKISQCGDVEENPGPHAHASNNSPPAGPDAPPEDLLSFLRSNLLTDLFQLTISPTPGDLTAPDDRWWYHVRCTACFASHITPSLGRCADHLTTCPALATATPWDTPDDPVSQPQPAPPSTGSGLGLAAGDINPNPGPQPPGTGVLHRRPTPSKLNRRPAFASFSNTMLTILVRLTERFPDELEPGFPPMGQPALLRSSCGAGSPPEKRGPHHSPDAIAAPPLFRLRPLSHTDLPTTSGSTNLSGQRHHLETTTAMAVLSPFNPTSRSGHPTSVGAT